MTTLLHITTPEAWAKATSVAPTAVYRPDSLASEGFIHCSTPEQVVIAANNHFRGQEGLILLCIDADKVTHPIVDEDLYGTGIAFPHIYGALAVTAVTAVVDFPCKTDGTFALPAIVDE